MDLRRSSSLHGCFYSVFFFFSSRRRNTRFKCDWSSDVCSSDLCPPTGQGCCGSGSRRAPPAPSPSGRPGSSPRAGHRARCAACRWTPTGMSARGRTDTAPPMLEQKRSAPDDDGGEQAALDLLASGQLEIEGRLADASNATLYCTITPGPGGYGGAGSPSQEGSGGRSPPGKRKSRAGVGGPLPPDYTFAVAHTRIAGERPLGDVPLSIRAARDARAYGAARADGLC